MAELEQIRAELPTLDEVALDFYVSTVDAQRGRPGLQYLDYLGRPVPW